LIPAEVRPLIVPLADDDRFGHVGKLGNQRLGVRGDDELRAFGNVDEELGNLGNDIRVQAELIR
jgi:hypothetical protein